MNKQALEKFEALIEQHNLQQLKETMLTQAKMAVALNVGNPSEAIKLCQSKLGGRPDAPHDFIWPTKDDKHLSFIAQINLNEITQVAETQLPQSGLLSFFYNQQVWGFDPKDKGGFQVYFWQDTGALKEQQPPPGKIEKKFFGMISKVVGVREFEGCPLTAEQIITLPYDLDGVQLNNEQGDNYCDLLEAIGGHHRLLGHSEPVQNEMELECELVTNGIYCGDPSGYQDPRAQALLKSSYNWNLLLQINSEDKADMMWGDLGKLYFWIKDEDLAARNFSLCWMISQCH